MEFSENNKVSAFDTLFCTNHIQMLKVLLSYTDHQTQKSLAVYIKFLELQYTIEYYQKNPYPLCGCSAREQSFDFGKICEELLPYCTQEERSRLEQMQGLFKGMEMYREMSKTMEMMKEFMPDMGDMFSGNPFGDGSFGNDSPQNQANMMSLLMNMLSPEQKEMFTMFGGMNNHDNAVDE